MHIQEKMVNRLFLKPLFIIGLGFFGVNIMDFIAGNSQNTGVLAPLVKQITMMFSLIPLALIAWGILWICWNAYRYWKWKTGNNQDVCPNCGGMVTAPINGRYGEYVKCLACGKNTSTY
jgi:hypothetical protein